MSSTSFTIRTPCSSANIGPGFDVIGLALSLFLELQVTVDSSKSASEHPLNCLITYDDQSNSTEKISLDPEVNLITRVALYVLRCHDQRAFPVETRVHIVNPIPLSRGLGSSGTAVVAGVVLGNEVGKLGLSKDRLLDYCLMIGESTLFSDNIYTDYCNRASPRQRRCITLWRLCRNVSQRTQTRRCCAQRNTS
jgi:homoserine kinase